MSRNNSTSAPMRPDASNKVVFSGEFELNGAFELPPRPTTAAGRPYEEARLLVRIGGEPVGFVTVVLGTESLSQTAVMQAIERDLDAAVKAEMTRQIRAPASLIGSSATDGYGLAAERRRLPSVSVVVCTRDRAHILPNCLNALAQLEYDALDFIIVDNAPADDDSRQLVTEMAYADSRFQYVRELLPGLSHARNRGLAQSTSEIIAYTDDDVRVDPLWVRGLIRGFERRLDVGCVTGMVASASLELPAEQYFDGRVGWSSNCKPGVYDANHGPTGTALHPYAAGALGTGANFAVRVELLREIGGFDESLGAGSPCYGGEDFDVFVRFILAGYAIAYEPAALVWHEHRSGEGDLRKQMYGYGRSLSAYLFKYMSSRATALDVLRRLPQGLRHLGVLGARSSRMGARTGLAQEPVMAEIRGLIAGPLAYARARRAQDPERRSAVAP